MFQNLVLWFTQPYFHFYVIHHGNLVSSQCGPDMPTQREESVKVTV